MKYAGLILVFLSACLYSYSYGVDVQKGREALARQSLIDEQKAEIDRLKSQKQKIEVRYRDRVKTVYKMADPTGCLDTTLGAIGLYKPSDNQARP